MEEQKSRPSIANGYFTWKNFSALLFVAITFTSVGITFATKTDKEDVEKACSEVMAQVDLKDTLLREQIRRNQDDIKKGQIELKGTQNKILHILLENKNSDK